MRQYSSAYGQNSQGLLDDAGSLVSRLLNEGQNQLTPMQQSQLQQHQQQIEQYRMNPQAVQSNPTAMNGLLGNIVQVAGPLIAGYATHQLLQHLAANGMSVGDNPLGSLLGGSSGPFNQSSGPFDQSAGPSNQSSGPFDQSAGPFDQGSGPFDRSVQSGPFGQNRGSGQEQENVQRRSTGRGQSVEEG